jgi:ABC-2 type transport system permease protein
MSTRSEAPARIDTAARSFRREFAALWAFAIREYRVWQSYRVNQVMWMTNIFVTTLMFFLLGKTIAGHAAHLLGPYGTNYMSFVVVGVSANYFIGSNVADPFTRIQRSYFNGTMDLLLLSPMSVFTPLIGFMWKSVLDDYPRLFFVGGFGMLFFGATFHFDQWPLAFLFTVLLLLAGFGIGVISASSFYLLNIKKGEEPVQFIVQSLLAAVLAGSYYPITVLPHSLQLVACVIPHTYAYDALRRLLDPGASTGTAVLPIQHALPLSPLAVDGLALGLMSVLLLPLGFWMYARGIERARRNGTLTRWQ